MLPGGWRWLVAVVVVMGVVRKGMVSTMVPRTLANPLDRAAGGRKRRLRAAPTGSLPAMQC